MKQNVLLAGFLTASLFLCLPSGAQDPSAVVTAHREEMENNFKRMGAKMEQLEDSLRSQQQRISSLDAEIHSLRNEVDRLKTRNESAATQDSIKRLADKIEEVDKKRIADNDLIILQLKSLGKTITKSVIQSEPRPEAPSSKQGSSEQTGPPEKSWAYQIKDGDNLSKIVTDLRAQKVNVTLKQILDANPKLDPKRLQIGQTIYIPQPTQ